MLLNCVTSSTNISSSDSRNATWTNAIDSACSSLAPRNSMFSLGSNVWVSSQFCSLADHVVGEHAVDDVGADELHADAIDALNGIDIGRGSRLTKLEIGTRPLLVVILRSSSALMPRSLVGSERGCLLRRRLCPAGTRRLSRRWSPAARRRPPERRQRRTGLPVPGRRLSCHSMPGSERVSSSRAARESCPCSSRTRATAGSSRSRE